MAHQLPSRLAQATPRRKARREINRLVEPRLDSHLPGPLSTSPHLPFLRKVTMAGIEVGADSARRRCRPRSPRYARQDHPLAGQGDRSGPWSKKDYWIMHCLYGLQQLGHKKSLRALQQLGMKFELKGGTSLSKRYQIINRFSEDIDIRLNLIDPVDADCFLPASCVKALAALHLRGLDPVAPSFHIELRRRLDAATIRIRSENCGWLLQGSQPGGCGALSAVSACAKEFLGSHRTVITRSPPQIAVHRMM